MTAAASQKHQAPSWIEDSTWIYCVKCRTYPGSEAGGGRRPYFVTDCGHIYCSQCRVNAESSQCFICQRKGLKFLEITDGIKSHPQVGVFFQNLADTCSQLSNLFRFQQRHKTLNKQFLFESGADEASLVAQYGSLAMAPIEELEKRHSELTKRRKLTEQKLRASCTEKHQQLMEIEAIVMKLKSLGYREEDILDIHVDGRPVPSVKTICETRTALQYASKVLGGGGRAQDSTTSGSSNTKPTTTPTASIAGRRAIGDQGGVQSAQLGSRVIAAGMVTPQQQQQSQHGGVTKVVTPHQFGLTPFPRVGTPSQGSVSTPSTHATPVIKKALAPPPPPPPPPPFPPHLSRGPLAVPAMTSNQVGRSPRSWHTPTKADGIFPPRFPSSRRGQAQGTSPSRAPSPQFTSQQIGRQFQSSQSVLTPHRQHQMITPRQTITSRPARASPSPVLQPRLSSPAASGVATGSAVGLQLTPTRSTTPTNQLIRNVSHHSLQRIMKATPSPVEMMSPKSARSTLSRPRTPMSVQSASPSSSLGTPMSASTPTNSGRVSIRGPPSGGRMGRVTAKVLTPRQKAIQEAAAALLL